jgi:RNA polymerase sigma factor (TIGR02999 family)
MRKIALTGLTNSFYFHRCRGDTGILLIKVSSLQDEAPCVRFNAATMETSADSQSGSQGSGDSAVTRVLTAIEQGQAQATNELLPLVYNELRRMAAHKMANERPGQTLQPTELVHEAWLRLVQSPCQSWQNRAHFFGAAAEAMRRILISRARRKRALRRGGGAPREDLRELEIAGPAPDEQLLALDEALDRFAAREPRHAELIKLRYFVGLSLEEAAKILGISEATAKRWGAYARTWLYQEMKQTEGKDQEAAR